MWWQNTGIRSEKQNKRVYDRLEKNGDNLEQLYPINSQRKLFKSNTSSKEFDLKVIEMDHRLVKFYDHSWEKLKYLISKLNISKFEKCYIDTVKELYKLQHVIDPISYEQSEVIEINNTNRDKIKIMENQLFDADGNLFSSMWKSIASGVSSGKGSPIDIQKVPIQGTIGSKNNSPMIEIITKTPVDKKKLFGNLKQTSSSLIRKAQAMKEPMHSNRKLFSNDGQKNNNNAISQLGIESYDKKTKKNFELVQDKENNCHNAKFASIQSPIPSIKGTWNNIISPTALVKIKAISPDNTSQKLPMAIHSVNSRGMSNYGTPSNGLKGSIVAPSTCGSTQLNFGNFRNTILVKSNDSKSRNTYMKQLSTGNTGAVSR